MYMYICICIYVYVYVYVYIYIYRLYTYVYINIYYGSNLGESGVPRILQKFAQTILETQSLPNRLGHRT